MNKGVIELQATGVTYYSQGDEDVFFEWLNKIPCVKKIEGHFRTLYILIDLERLDDDGLCEILALFIRYKIPLKQLRTLYKDDFPDWFKNKKRIWYKDIFDD